MFTKPTTNQARPCVSVTIASVYALAALVSVTLPRADALSLRPSAIDVLRSVDAPGGLSRDSAIAELDEHIVGLLSTKTYSGSTRLKGNRVRLQKSSNPTDDNGWSVIPADGVSWHDPKVGEIGTCYFIAALIAVARLHPDIIEGMFIRRELWTGSPRIYLTRWSVSGVQQEIAVDGNIPTNPETVSPYFTRPNNGADFWPVILEKAWAKMFGSYFSITGGTMAEVFKGIVNAPVHQHDHAFRSEESIKAKMYEAFRENFPVGAASQPNSINLPNGHAYVVFGFSNNTDFGLTVTLYNPWARDVYDGAIPNVDKEDGFFECTWSEYISSFHHTTIAYIFSDYVSSNVMIQTKGNTTIVDNAMLIELKTEKPFVVNLEWPNPRFFTSCPELNPIFTLSMSPIADPLDQFYGEKQSPSQFNAAIVKKAGKNAGKYMLYTYANFKNGHFLDFVVVSVYAPHAVKFYELGETSNEDLDVERESHTVFLTQEGLCDQIMIAGHGLFERNEDVLVNGIPTFRAVDLEQGDAHILYFDSKREESDDTHIYSYGDNTWKLVDTLENAMGGFYFEGFDKGTDVTCVSGTYTQPPSENFGTVKEDAANTMAAYKAASKYYSSGAFATAVKESYKYATGYGWRRRRARENSNGSAAAPAAAPTSAASPPESVQDKLAVNGSLLDVGRALSHARSTLLQNKKVIIRKIDDKRAGHSELSLAQGNSGELALEEEHELRRRLVQRAAEGRSNANIIHQPNASHFFLKRSLLQQQDMLIGDAASDNGFADGDSTDRCAKLLHRLNFLDNTASIQASGSDEMFPADVSSIGPANETCEDTTEGHQKQCWEYNHWDTFGSIMHQLNAWKTVANMTVNLQEQCVDTNPVDDNTCGIKNLCNTTLAMLCKKEDANGELFYSILSPITELFEGTADIEFCDCKFNTSTEGHIDR